MRGEKNGKAAYERPQRLARNTQVTEFLSRRTEAFQKAMNQKGLPLTWGTGKPRDDARWKRDREYLIEDGFFDKNGKIVR